MVLRAARHQLCDSFRRPSLQLVSAVLVGLIAAASPQAILAQTKEGNRIERVLPTADDWQIYITYYPTFAQKESLAKNTPVVLSPGSMPQVSSTFFAYSACEPLPLPSCAAPRCSTRSMPSPTPSSPHSAPKLRRSNCRRHTKLLDRVRRWKEHNRVHQRLIIVRSIQQEVIRLRAQSVRTQRAAAARGVPHRLDVLVNA